MLKPQSSKPQGSWHWSVDDKRLDIETVKGSDLSDMSGQWSLGALGQMMEGLSKGRLQKAFDSSDGPVRCGLRLSNGRDVHLVGAFVSDTEARGMLLSGDFFGEDDDSDTDLGPDLEPVYQPIISLRDGETVGFEALARWGGMFDTAPPSRYEDDALASNMLIRSAETLAMLRESSGREDLFMHVNLTARDLARGTMPALIEALMNGYKLPSRALRIELTEQAALRDASLAITAALAVKSVGAGLVLDDFGTGHSSFEWLADLPADSLKIDRGLIARIHEPRVETILSAVTLLAKRLNMTTTAEGVEDKEDAIILRSIGFDHVQGFAFSHPLTAEAAETFLKRSA